MKFLIIFFIIIILLFLNYYQKNKNNLLIISHNKKKYNTLTDKLERGNYLLNDYQKRFFDYNYKDYYPENNYVYWGKHYDPTININFPTQKK